MIHAVALLLIALAAWPVWAGEAAPVELQLVGEYPVEGMPNGNLSGLARCGGVLQALSDRDDAQLYRLEQDGPVWHAVAEPLQIPAVVESGLPWGLQVRNRLSGPFRGGELDFEALGCDGYGNRYLASEGVASVLKVDPAGHAEWLRLPRGLLSQARASGMLVQFNAMYEGLAIDPAGKRLWLAAERERRGLMVVHLEAGRWRCLGSCVLLAENGQRPAPARPEVILPEDFSDLALFEGRLYSLERLTQRICRRAPDSGTVERCWSFAGLALAPAHRYDTPHGVGEALVVDADGAWLGVDTNGLVRADGEARPVIWRLAAPAGGWGASDE